MKIKDLKEREVSVIRCLITDIVGKTTKNGDAFCTLTMTDGNTQVSGNLSVSDRIRYMTVITDMSLILQ